MARIPRLTRKSLLISAGAAGFLTLAIIGVVGAAQLMSREVARRAGDQLPRGQLLDISLVTPEPKGVAPGEQMDVGTLVDGFDADSLRTVSADMDPYFVEDAAEVPPQREPMQGSPVLRKPREGMVRPAVSGDLSPPAIDPPPVDRDRPSFGFDEAQAEIEARREQRHRERAAREARWRERRDEPRSSPDNGSLFY